MALHGLAEKDNHLSSGHPSAKGDRACLRSRRNQPFAPLPPCRLSSHLCSIVAHLPCPASDGSFGRGCFCTSLALLLPITDHIACIPLTFASHPRGLSSDRESLSGERPRRGLEYKTIPPLSIMVVILISSLSITLNSFDSTLSILSKFCELLPFILFEQTDTFFASRLDIYITFLPPPK